MADEQRKAPPSTEDEIKQAVLTKMKSLTNAREDVCVEILESNSYDLHTSVEAYFSR